MSASIRIMTADDFAAWSPLWRSYLDFYRSEVEEAVTRETFSRLVSAAEPMGAFLAWSAKGQAIGLAHWIAHRSCWTRGDYCYLQDLYVENAERGAGIGRALIEAVAQTAARNTCARVYWLTHETNKPAIDLYEKLARRSGFIQYVKT